jgi:hypothetical protein
MELTLRSAAFEFGQTEKKELTQGTKLPVSVAWGPVAKAAGDWTLFLAINNFNGGRGQTDGSTLLGNLVNDSIFTDINGEKKEIRPQDDIALPITVLTKIGVSSRTYEYLTLGGAALSFVGSGALFGLFGKRQVKAKTKKTNKKKK